VAQPSIRAHVQQHRLAKGRPAVHHHHARDTGQGRVDANIVQRHQLGIFLFQLDGGFLPGLHLLQFAAQFLVLFIDPGIGLEPADHLAGFRHGGHGPAETWHHPVDDGDAHRLGPGTVDAPEQEQRDQHKGHQRDQHAPHRCGEVWTLACHSGDPCPAAPLSCRSR
jgi:hypothetical protein